MDDLAGWITAVAAWAATIDWLAWGTMAATAAAALGTWRTVHHLALDRAERREAGLPILSVESWSAGYPPMITIVAVNPGEQRWRVIDVTCTAHAFEIARVMPSDEDDGYGNGVLKPGPRGKTIAIDEDIPPALAMRPGTFIVARALIYGDFGGKDRPRMQARVQSMPRRIRSRRPTATISIMD